MKLQSYILAVFIAFASLATWAQMTNFSDPQDFQVSGVPINTNSITCYSTNVSLTASTSWTFQLAKPFMDTNYVIGMPAALININVANKTPTNFTLTFSVITYTGTLEGLVYHK